MATTTTAISKPPPIQQLQQEQQQQQEEDQQHDPPVCLLREWSYSPRTATGATTATHPRLTANTAAPSNTPATATAATAATDTTIDVQQQHAASLSQQQQHQHPPVVAIAPAVVIRDESGSCSSVPTAMPATPAPAEAAAAAAPDHQHQEHNDGSTRQNIHRSGSNGYSYPVATFVSNLVRSSMEHIYTGIAESIHEVDGLDNDDAHVIHDNDMSTLSPSHPRDPHARNDPDSTTIDGSVGRVAALENDMHRLSIRSAPPESDLQTAAAAAAAMEAAAQTYPVSVQTDNAAARTSSVSERTFNRPIQQQNNNDGIDACLDEADYILVNGDLIALPSPPSRYDDHHNSPFDKAAEEFHKKNCKSKGFKRFRKWVKKKALGGSRHSKGMKGGSNNEDKSPKNDNNNKSQRGGGKKKDHSRRNRKRTSSSESLTVATTNENNTIDTLRGGGGEDTTTNDTNESIRRQQQLHLNNQQIQQQQQSHANAAFDTTTESIQQHQHDLNNQRQQQQLHAHQQQQQQTPFTPAAGMPPLTQQQTPFTPAAGMPPPPPNTTMPSFPSPPPQEASFVGTTDQLLLEANVLPGQCELYASAYIEEEGDGKEDIKADDLAEVAADVNCAAATAMTIGEVSQQQKVDKVETLLLEEQIQQYQQQHLEEEQQDFETSSELTSLSLSRTESAAAKSVPLSRAIPSDMDVYNDTLKVIMVGAPHVGKSSLVRALRDKSPKKKNTKKRKADRLSISVNTWLPPSPPHITGTVASAGEEECDNKDYRHDGYNTNETMSSITSSSSSTSSQQPIERRPIKFSIWDVNEGANSGTHPSTQSLFYSEGALYVLVWDMAITNGKTYRRKQQPKKKRQKTTSSSGYDTDESSDDFSSDDDDDDYDDDDYVVEEANRLADRALEIDIQDRVLSWVNCITSTSPNSAILPVVTMPEDYDDDNNNNNAIVDEDEAQRRCSMMQAMLMQHIQSLHQQRMNENDAPVLVGEGIFRLNSMGGIEQIQETILKVATPSYDNNNSIDSKDSHRSSSSNSNKLFPHVGSQVSQEVVLVLQCIQRLREDDQKVVLVEQVVAETGLCLDDVIASLQFLSSIGELLYYGSATTTATASASSDTNDTSTLDILSRFVVLCRKWLVSALSCILQHHDLKHEVAAVRTFMNMQCEYSGQRFVEDDVTRTLLKGSNSNCPMLSSTDAAMLWMERSFMSEAASRTTETAPPNTTLLPESMYEFLEQLLVRYGVFLPLSDSNATPVYFIPSLLSSTDSRHTWTYKSSDSWMTTLCHSWLLRDGSPSNMTEQITVSVLQNLYEFAAQSFDDGDSSNRSKTYPSEASASLASSMMSEPELPVGRITIHQIMCWKNSLFVSIGYLHEDRKTGELRESVSEVLVTLVDQHSDQCVASNSMGGGMKRLIVCGKGQVGHHGSKLWDGGFRLVLDSVKATVADFGMANVDRQVVCPECLAQSYASLASTWSWDSVRSANMSGQSDIICMSGHRVDANLLCGTCKPPKQLELHRGTTPIVPVTSLLKSVVVVGLWDDEQKTIRNIGSGFIVDKKQGLVVTAAHILFDMGDGQDNENLLDAKALIGVIPGNGNTAVFRYMADIAAHDINNMDACVLRICARFENDVGGEGKDCANQTQIPLLGNVSGEKLQHLKLTKKYELEESIRIIGFNQGGEGLLQEGNHVNRSVDVTKGYICKNFKALPDDSSDSEDRSVEQKRLLTRRSFIPREEIVAMCPTINGHSGGPCVNAEGKVVGILSRADPADQQRCYLVPSSELKSLVTDAKANCTKKAVK